MKKRLLMAMAAVALCVGNAVYVSAEQTTDCKDKCDSTGQCTGTCNVCYPNPIGGPYCSTGN